MNSKKVSLTAGKSFLAAFILISSLLGSCSKGSKKTGNAGLTPYFNLQQYFKTESKKLNTSKPILIKSILVDGKVQTRKIISTDWSDEFSFFINSDINKPAWFDKYKIDSAATYLKYTARDLNLKVRSINIEMRTAGGVKKVTSVRIEIAVTNFLYQLNETLSYYPDSLYTIVRKQHINLLGSKLYEVRGVIGH